MKSFASTRMRKQPKALLLATILAAVSADAAANVFISPGDTVATQLQEVEVTVSRTPDELKVSSPVHTLDASDVLSLGITDISDAMRRLPGVTLRDYGSGGMKTISVRGLGAQHTNVVYDGVVLNDIQGGQTDLSRYSLQNLDYLALNVGDGDDLSLPARSVSSASTLTIETMDSPDLLDRTPGVEVLMRAASFGTYNPFVNFSIGNGNNLGMTLNAEYTHAKNNYTFLLENGSETTRERRNNAEYEIGHAEWNGVWKPSAASRLQAKAYFYQSDRNLPGPVIYYNNVSNQRLEDLNTFGQLAFNSRLSDIFSLAAVAKYNYSRTRYRDKDGKYPGGELDSRYEQQEEYISANLTCRPDHTLTLSYAADYWHNSLRSNQKENNRPVRDSFLQAFSAKWEIWRLTATARVLWSIIRDKADLIPDGKTLQHLAPSVGVSIRPLYNADWRLRASYKNIYRMPTFNELYFDHYGSVDLKPEIADQINVGTTYDADFGTDRFHLTLIADGYYNLVRDKIVAMPFNMFVMTMTNLGKVSILGADLTLATRSKLKERHYIALDGSYSFMRAEIRTSADMADWKKQVAYTPLHSGSASLGWENPWVNITLHGTGCSERFSTNTNLPSTRLKPYFECGLTLFREFKLRYGSISLRADAINLLDTQYELIARYPMPGRSFSITVGYNV